MTTTLEQFMAAIRFVETGSYEGRYEQKRRANGLSLVGAYGFREDAWPGLSRFAGYGGAPWQNPWAQDAVAASIFDQLFRRYGNWSLVAAAHVGGTQSADRIARRGFSSPAVIRNTTLREYVENTSNVMDTAPTPERPTYRMSSPAGVWVNPVAGESNWSAGSFLYQRTGSQIAAGKTPIHKGIDVYAQKGTPIVSPVSGKIRDAGFSNKSGYYVSLVGDDGIRYFFAHLESDPRVASGETVAAGYHLGFVGASGNAQGTSPHLHMEMRMNDTNELLNPAAYLEGAYASHGRFTGLETDVTRMGREAFSPDHGPNALIQSMANSLAGGEREDYRLYGHEDHDHGDDSPQETGLETPDNRDPVDRFLNGPL